MLDIKDFKYVCSQPNLIFSPCKYISWMLDIKDFKYNYIIQPQQPIHTPCMLDIKDFKYDPNKPTLTANT